MPDVIGHCIVTSLKVGNLRILSQRDKPISYQLVGEVTAHQGLRVAGLRGWSATLGLRHCPDSYGRLQSRIIVNARKCEHATPLEEDGLRVVNSCQQGVRVALLIVMLFDSTCRGSHG